MIKERPSWLVQCRRLDVTRATFSKQYKVGRTGASKTNTGTTRNATAVVWCRGSLRSPLTINGKRVAHPVKELCTQYTFQTEMENSIGGTKSAILPDSNLVVAPQLMYVCS